MEPNTAIVSLLLTLSGWILHSDTTNCTVYLSSQPLTLNLLCPSAICRLELFNMRGCDSDCPSCNIADCNKVYNLCNTSSSQRPSSTGNAAQSNEQPITCIFVAQPMGVIVTCEKGDDQWTFMSNNTQSAWREDLGINCYPSRGDLVHMCIKMYSFCMEPQPMACPPLGEMVHTLSTVLNNQCTNSIIAQSTYTKRVTFTVYSSTSIYTPVTVRPSSTTSLKLQTIETTNVFSSTFFTNVTSYPSSMHSTTSQTCSATSTVNRATIPAIGATVGLLVVLLIVVTMGWVYTCNRKIELRLKPQNISNKTNINLNNNPAYVTKTTCQRNPAYVVTDISIGEPDKSQAVINEIEPTYEMVQPSSAQAKKGPCSQIGEELEPTYEIVQQSSAQMDRRPGSQIDEDEYNKLNREVPLYHQQKGYNSEA